jgi:hypothetical protein
MYCEGCHVLLERWRWQQEQKLREGVERCCQILGDANQAKDAIDDAETFVRKHANEGNKLVDHYRAMRAKAGKGKGRGI